MVFSQTRTCHSGPFKWNKRFFVPAFMIIMKNDFKGDNSAMIVVLNYITYQAMSIKMNTVFNGNNI